MVLHLGVPQTKCTRIAGDGCFAGAEENTISVSASDYDGSSELTISECVGIRNSVAHAAQFKRPQRRCLDRTHGSKCVRCHSHADYWDAFAKAYAHRAPLVRTEVSSIVQPSVFLIVHSA